MEVGKQFTDAEITFMRRMLPHFMAGMSPVDAAAAVLDDDARIFSSVMAHSDHQRTARDRADIRSEMSRIVYSKIRVGFK